MAPEDLWQDFCAHSDVLPNHPYTSWYFADNQHDADELVGLVLEGRKRGTSSAYDIYPHIEEKLPADGDYSVLTDWSGVARCVIQTVKISIIPFEQVTENFARSEGEGDLSLANWRNVHRDFFSRELAEFGIVFNMQSPVVCETFEVRHIAQHAHLAKEKQTG